MSKSVEIEFEYAGKTTQQYHIFVVKNKELSPIVFPKRIYLKKDYFKKELAVKMTVTQGD